MGRGVPQGLMLGPLQCLICMNDLERDVGSKIVTVADVTCSYRQHSGFKKTAWSNRIHKWVETSPMIFNTA